jgi:hypothetical protein
LRQKRQACCHNLSAACGHRTLLVFGKYLNQLAVNQASVASDCESLGRQDVA